MNIQALEGVRVLELGEGVSAAFCAKLFADYGAEVIKLEKPGRGDITRHWGPFPGDVPDPERSGTFFCLNTNKQSVTLDLETPRGQEIARALIRDIDVVIENNPPAKMKAWGLDYDTLSALNPDLIMISITPFGQTGPYADWKGHDLNAFHLSATGSRYCGRMGEAPLEQGTYAAEYFGAYVAATWGLAAVFGVEQAGGEHIDVSCAEVVAAVFVGGQNIGGAAQNGACGKRTGVGMPLAAPATILPCKDGHVWMMALEKGQWHGLVRAMGNPEWAQIDIFDDMFQRAQNADLIYSMMDEWLRDHTKQEIMDLCQQHNCPSTAVYDVRDVAEHRHLRERGYLVDLDHPALGRTQTFGAPVHIPDAPGGPKAPAPLLGQHTDHILPARGVGVAERVERGRRTTPRKLPLAGIRVANFGWGWLGPVAGQTLARLGAEVYKIESHARVDINRTIPPFATGHENDPDCALQNHAGWAGNGSVTINLKQAEGQELARRLVGECDVVLENFGPGVMHKLHLGYGRLRDVRPDLLMISMPAAGLTGPMKNVRTYGMSLSSITGLDSVTGYPGGAPIPMENAFADPLGGIIGAFAALLGLNYRKRTGKGQHIDFSQQEGVMQLMAPAFMDYVLNRRVAGPRGNRHPQNAAAPHGVFPCRGDDRWISIVVASDAEWESMRAAMGNPAWAQAARYDTLAGRIAHLGELHAALGEWTREFDDRELATRLQAAGIAATPVLNVADLLTDPHYRARRTFVEVEHPLGFRETVYGDYVKTRQPPPPLATGPVMGQDNEKVFRHLLGMSDDDYRALVERQVIF